MEDPKISFDMLDRYVKDNDIEKVQRTLNGIIKNPKEVNCDITPVIPSLLKREQDIQILTAKAVAELAKNNDQRTLLANKININDLLLLLNKAINSNEIALVIQLCRALGNLCFENDNSRSILLELNVIPVMTNLLNEGIKFDTDDYQQFRTVSCGFLLNFLMDKEDILKSTWESGILLKLEAIMNLEKDKLNDKDDCLMHLLFILGLYSDNVANCWFPESLNTSLVDLLKRSENLDISEMCLQLLHQQSDNDELKLSLAQCELCETLHGLLEKHISLASDSRIRALVQQACEIIVIVLTGDDSMHYLYGKKILVQAMIDWLSNSDLDFLVTGILAVGNFARTEQHCIDMVENGIMLKLIDILSKNKSQSDDIRLQHALLSALRNIAIPQQNKSKLVSAGLVQIVVSMLQNDHPSVVYKLLGTLRMIVDKQDKVAVELLQNKELITQLTEWGDKSDHPGVSGESPRLMAWLIKHCCRANCPMQTISGSNSSFKEGDSSTDCVEEDVVKKALTCFINVKGSVGCVANMLSSSHIVMQNEALVALSILAATFIGSKKHDQRINIHSNNQNVAKILDVEQDATKFIEQIMIDIDIIPKLNNFFLSAKDDHKELLENAVTLMTFLIKLDNIKQKLCETNIGEKLKRMQTNQIFVDKLQSIQNLLQNMIIE